MRGVSELPAPLDFNGCDTKPGSIEPAEVQANPGDCRTFVSGTAYPIATLPDDLHDETIPNRDRWALKGALFWNDCQGWWHESITDYWLVNRYRREPIARFWSPEPPDPMTREQILAGRGEVVCPECDWAIDPNKPHICKPSEGLIEQRRLQAAADAQEASS